ncbi:TetR family transcriptional regulator [Mycolicibacterium porcinum]|nr:TetR family transcriptional regulator [Mycolicibacterium porcinum]
MGRKGWAGSPPSDDGEARKWIIDATLRIMGRSVSAQATVSEVAEALGISRRTVYNYFASTDELFTATAELALQGFVSDVKNLIADLDVVTQLVEVVAYIIEQLPREPHLAWVLAHDRSNTFSRTMLAASEIERCRLFLDQAQVDWAALGYDDTTMGELVEFVLRIIQSMVVAPPETPRSGTELRAYLRRWVGPAIAQ